MHPPHITAQIIYVLSYYKLRYFLFEEVTGFRRPDPIFLTGIVLRAPMMDERDFVFLKKRWGNFFTESSSPLLKMSILYLLWRVVEISTLIGSRLPLRHNFPGDNSQWFSERANVPPPHLCSLFHPITFRLIITDITARITYACAHLKPMTQARQFPASILSRCTIITLFEGLG